MSPKKIKYFLKGKSLKINFNLFSTINIYYIYINKFYNPSLYNIESCMNGETISFNLSIELLCI